MEDYNMPKTFIIAEIGQAHEGSLGILHSYIDALANTGVDAIKFQTHIAQAESSEYEPFRVKFSYEDDTRYNYWKRMEFTLEQWKGIKKHCDEVGLEFISSPFSNMAVDWLEEIGVENGVSYGNNEDCKIIRVNQVAIGKARRDPGYNFDGTKAEDMYYADEPPRSASIKQDPIFKLSDYNLEHCLNTLMRSLSIGKMETLALDMANHFIQGIGGTYKNEILDQEIANNSAFVTYHLALPYLGAEVY